MGLVNDPKTVDQFQVKWVSFIPIERTKEFYEDLLRLMSYYRSQGERLEHDYPRSKGDMGQ